MDHVEAELVARRLAAGDPTGWFEDLYAAGVDGRIELPWSRTAPHPLLVSWATDRPPGTGRQAVVVGCGLGADAEYVASLGYTTTAFDISPTAVATARDRHPTSPVRYVVADLLDPPTDWLRGYDLVVEIITVQALPDPPRTTAIVNVGRLVAPGGTLIALEWAATDGEPVEGPPWPLTRAEIDAFATDGLRTVTVDEVTDPRPHVDGRRWLAEFHRPDPG